MAFVAVQFASDHTIAIIRKEWLTPRKSEVLWPPVKLQTEYEKAVKAAEPPQENWKTFDIERFYFECGWYHFICSYILCMLINNSLIIGNKYSWPIFIFKYNLVCFRRLQQSKRKIGEAAIYFGLTN